MKILNLIFVVMTFSFLTANSQQSGKLVILHTNDMHSKLRGFAPETGYSPLVTNDDSTVGGFARLASLIAAEKYEGGDNTLVLDAGDFLMGTLFHHLETMDGFQLRLMKRMGYDFVGIGNHEFDFGPDMLAQIIESGLINGDIPQMILSNANFDKKNPLDDRLEALFTDGKIKREIIIEKKELGLKIGFFALMGVDAADVAPASKPITFSKQIRVARKMVKHLKKEGCNMIICLSHSGVSKEEDGKMGGEDFRLASKVRGIDLIISGHTHTKLSEPMIVKGIPIVQAGSYGENLGRITFNIVDGHPVFEAAVLKPIDDKIPGDRDIDEQINARIDFINSQLLNRLGLDYTDTIVEASFDMECDEYGDLEGSNLGPLVADAIQDYVNRNSTGGSDISIVAAGVIRDAVRPGYQSVPDIFRVMSLGSGNDNVPGYPLARVYVTGRELKNIVEILLVAWKKSPSNYIYYSGINVKYDPSAGLLRKVTSVEIVKGNGSTFEVDFDKKSNKLYSITANSYILEFIGIIKSMSFGLINVTPKNEAGIEIADFSNAVIDFTGEDGVYREGKEWLALTEFLSLMPDTNGNGTPDLDKYYLNPDKNVIAIKK